MASSPFLTYVEEGKAVFSSYVTIRLTFTCDNLENMVKHGMMQGAYSTNKTHLMTSIRLRNTLLPMATLQAPGWLSKVHLMAGC